MSQIPDALREQVIARAGGRCEYCHIPLEGQVAWFPVDHIVPRSQDGKTELANLALACPRCNAHKWAALSAPDPETGLTAALFNPRTQIWAEHFRWSRGDGLEIEGISPSGRATVARLRMNVPDMVSIRRILSQLGISPRAIRSGDPSP